MSLARLAVSSRQEKVPPRPSASARPSSPRPRHRPTRRHHWGCCFRRRLLPLLVLLRVVTRALGVVFLGRRTKLVHVITCRNIRVPSSSQPSEHVRSMRLCRRSWGDSYYVGPESEDERRKLSETGHVTL